MNKLYASASVGHGGKQRIARIVGMRDEKDFDDVRVGGEVGPRKEQYEAEVTSPGLYEVRNAVGGKGKLDNSYVLVCEIGAESMEEFQCTKAEAVKIAKKLGEGKAFDDIVLATPEGWDFKKDKPAKPTINQAEVDAAVESCRLVLAGKPPAFVKRVLAGLKAEAPATPAAPETPAGGGESESAETTDTANIAA